MFCFSPTKTMFRDRSLFMWGGGGEKSWGGPGLLYSEKRGGPKENFKDGWGWVIVCFVKNHIILQSEDLN